MKVTTRTVRSDHPLDSISAVFFFPFSFFPISISISLLLFFFFSFLMGRIIILFSTPPSKDHPDQQELSVKVKR